MNYSLGLEGDLQDMQYIHQAANYFLARLDNEQKWLSKFML